MATKSYTLLQLSDSHLSAAPDAELKGINTSDSLAAVAALAAKDRRTYDALIATGDLSQDGSMESYQRFLSSAAVALSNSDAEFRWLAGNHDDPSVMAQVVAPSRQLRLGRWLILLVDSKVEDGVYGELGEAQLASLRTQLAETSEFVLLCLHHNPSLTGANWIHDIGLRDGPALLELLQEFDCVRAVLHGHIHHRFEHTYKQLTVLGTPSTCVQFCEQTDEFALDTQQPGYRWLTLHDDGSFDTGVERLDEGCFLPKTAEGPYVLYLHGFLSSPQSVKARQTLAYCEKQGIEIDIPFLKEGPAASLAMLRERLRRGLNRHGSAVLIGSSLGAYYATALADEFGLRAALINPAVRPYLLLRDYLGEQKNHYSDDIQLVTEAQMQELLDMEVQSLARPQNFLVMLQTGDETLDYREAAEKYAASKLLIHEGGDHSYVGFEQELPQVFAFLLSRNGSKAR